MIQSISELREVCDRSLTPELFKLLKDTANKWRYISEKKIEDLTENKSDYEQKLTFTKETKALTVVLCHTISLFEDLKIYEYPFAKSFPSTVDIFELGLKTMKEMIDTGNYQFKTMLDYQNIRHITRERRAYIDTYVSLGEIAFTATLETVLELSRQPVTEETVSKILKISQMWFFQEVSPIDSLEFIESEHFKAIPYPKISDSHKAVRAVVFSFKKLYGRTQHGTPPSSGFLLCKDIFEAGMKTLEVMIQTGNYNFETLPEYQAMEELQRKRFSELTKIDPRWSYVFDDLMTMV